MAVAAKNGKHTADRMAPEAGQPSTGIVIKPVDMRSVVVRIRGTAPLIVHKFGEKARRMMEEAQAGGDGPKKKKVRPPRVPDEDFKGAMHIRGDGKHGFPSSGFKGAMVAACRMISGFPMTLAKQSLFVFSPDMDPLIAIESEPPKMRTDTVRLESGVCDLRYRPEYWPWEMSLMLRFDADQLTMENAVNLLARAGACVGVGEWRPASPNSQTGSYGTFELM